MNINYVKEHIEYLRKDKFSNEFYVALILYDVLGYCEEDITEEKINKAYDIIDEYDSIYNEDLRDRIRDELEEEYEEEQDNEAERDIWEK